MRLTQLSNFPSGVWFTYHIVIFDVHVSSFLDKVFHCVIMAFASCNMQGGPLVDETKLFTMRANMTTFA